MPTGGYRDTEDERLIATGLLVSEEFGGVDPSYLTERGLSIVWLDANTAGLTAELYKVIDVETANKIVHARRGVHNG